MLELKPQSIAFIHGYAQALQLHVDSSIFCSVKKTFTYTLLVKACVSSNTDALGFPSHQILTLWDFHHLKATISPKGDLLIEFISIYCITVYWYFLLTCLTYHVTSF